MASSFNYIAVAAIDFGTTFSGYAFATINDLKKDPTKTFAPNWHAADGGLVSSKTPTTVLLDKMKNWSTLVSVLKPSMQSSRRMKSMKNTTTFNDLR